MKGACNFILTLDHPRGNWSFENLDFFEKTFANPMRDLKGLGSHGKPRKYNFRDYYDKKSEVQPQHISLRRKQ